MRQKFNKQAFGAFLLLGMLMIGIVIFSGCIGQEEESTTGIPVTLLIQPNPMIPTRTTSYTMTDYRIHSSWANAIADDGNTTDYQWIDGTKYAINQIYWEWDVGYPDSLKQLKYDVNVSSSGPIYTNELKIYEHDGGETTIFSLNSTKTTNGTWTTSLSDTHWIDGKVYAHYEFEEEQWDSYTYTVSFDVMILEFNQITEEHQITESGDFNVILFTVKQNDVSITISEIPTNYQLIQITPEGSYRSTSNNIESTGNLTIDGCSLGTYMVVLNAT